MFNLNGMIPSMDSPWILALLIVVLIWSYVWKLLALWKSARKKSVGWFIVFALISTIGVLEILYIFLFSRLKIIFKMEKSEEYKHKIRRRKR